MRRDRNRESLRVKWSEHKVPVRFANERVGENLLPRA